MISLLMLQAAQANSGSKPEFGKVWQSIETPMPSQVIALEYWNGLWIAGTQSDGIWTSTDTINWTQRAASFGGGACYAIFVVPISASTATIVAGGANSNLYTSSNGITWAKRTLTNWNSHVRSISGDTSNLVITGNQGRIGWSSNIGVSWNCFQSPYTTSSIVSSTIAPYAGFVFAGQMGLVYAPSMTSSNLVNPVLRKATPPAFHAVTTIDGIVYVTASDGIYRSNNLTQELVKVYDLPIPSGSKVIMTGDRKYLLCHASQSLHISDISGTGWKTVQTNRTSGSNIIYGGGDILVGGNDFSNPGRIWRLKTE